MYTKTIALVTTAALSLMFVTAAMTTNAFATHRHHHHGSIGNSQSLAKSNSCGSNSKCSNIGSQIQGDGNSVSIVSSQ